MIFAQEQEREQERKQVAIEVLIFCCKICAKIVDAKKICLNPAKSMMIVSRVKNGRCFLLVVNNRLQNMIITRERAFQTQYERKSIIYLSQNDDSNSFLTLISILFLPTERGYTNAEKTLLFVRLLFMANSKSVAFFQRARERERSQTEN